MKITEKLGFGGQPEIELPLDLGDGPFLTAAHDAGAKAVQPAAVVPESVFQRKSPFRETFMTDIPILGKTNLVSIGYFRVSDKLKPNSFRRVFQHFRNQQSDRLRGPVIIMFRGSGIAIIEEGLGAIAPSPSKVEVPRPQYPTRRNARGRSSAPSTKGKSLVDAMDALEQAQAWATPTMPAQSSFFFIDFRFPGYEPSPGIALTPGDVMCFNPLTGSDVSSLRRANQTDRFLMGNSASDAQAYRLDYPLGRSIPVIFDIVNTNPNHSVVVDMNVTVLIDRSETKSD